MRGRSKIGTRSVRSGNGNRPAIAANSVIVLLGVWEAADVLAFLTPGFERVSLAVVDHIVVGVVLILAGGGAALTRSSRAARDFDWVAAGAGGWLVAASFLLRSGPVGAGLVNDLIVGVVVAVLGALAARRGA